MRLLHVETLEFLEILGPEVPRYAILSHTWSEEEVTFHEFLSAATYSRQEHRLVAETPSFVSKSGYAKVLATCQVAKSLEFEYVWIDTCCIDKSSSAELTEAINSMYKWYQRAAVCLVYLSDVISTVVNGFPAFHNDSLQRSRWFTRGWTLQELIAPGRTLWYDRDWFYAGAIDQSEFCSEDLLQMVTSITGISEEVIRTGDITGVSVAAKMSWASKRQTTRLEDVAYCLLGIFDVNMPLLYGEGTKAFIRLQEEIIKSSPDQTIFAWSTPAEGSSEEDLTSVPSTQKLVGFLATSPAAFADAADILPLSTVGGYSPYAITNKGLRIELAVHTVSWHTVVAVLQCSRAANPHLPLGISIRCPWLDEKYWSPGLANSNRLPDVEDVFRLQDSSSPTVLRKLSIAPPLRTLSLPQLPSSIPLLGGREPCCVFRRIPHRYSTNSLVPSSRWHTARRITRLAHRPPHHRVAAIQLDSDVLRGYREDDLSLFIRIIQDVRTNTTQASVVSGGYGLWGKLGRRFLTEADLQNEEFWAQGAVQGTRAHIFPHGAITIETRTVKVLDIPVVQVDVDILFELRPKFDPNDAFDPIIESVPVASDGMTALQSPANGHQALRHGDVKSAAYDFANAIFGWNPRAIRSKISTNTEKLLGRHRKLI